jgi:hypothetical protein
MIFLVRLLMSGQISQNDVSCLVPPCGLLTTLLINNLFLANFCIVAKKMNFFLWKCKFKKKIKYSFPRKVVDLGHFLNEKSVRSIGRNHIWQVEFWQTFCSKKKCCIASGSRSSDRPNFMGRSMEAVESRWHLFLWAYHNSPICDDVIWTVKGGIRLKELGGLT